MREIMREFSGIALAAISFFLCMLVLSNIHMSDGTTGVFNIIGKAAQTEDIKAGHGQDAGAMNVFGKRAKPVIVCEKNIHEKEPADLKSCFKVTDCEGNVVSDDSKKILAIKDRSGNDMMSYYNSSTGEVIFPNRGIYTVTIRVCDSSNVITRRDMELSVDF